MTANDELHRQLTSALERANPGDMWAKERAARDARAVLPAVLAYAEEQVKARLRAVADLADEYARPSSEWTRPMDGPSVMRRVRAALDGDQS